MMRKQILQRQNKVFTLPVAFMLYYLNLVMEGNLSMHDLPEDRLLDPQLGTKSSTSVLPLDLPSCPQCSVVPKLTSTSDGVVIFFHIPKTGGLSISLEFEHLVKTRPEDEYNIMKYDQRFEPTNIALQKLTNYLKNPTKKVQLIKFHGLHPVFSTVQKTYLETMREESRKKSDPFFVFCAARESLETFFSTFNFFCFQLQKYTECKAKPTLDHVMRMVKPNLQAHWLVCKMSQTFESMTLPSGPMRWEESHEEGSFFPLHCPDLLSKLVDNMDWIGQLDELGETIRLLCEDLGLPVGLKKKNPTSKKHIQLDRLSTLTKSEVETIKRGLQLNSKLYGFSK